MVFNMPEFTVLLSEMQRIVMRFLICKCFYKEENAPNLEMQRRCIENATRRRFCPLKNTYNPAGIRGHRTVFLLLKLQHQIWLSTSHKSLSLQHLSW